MMKQVLMQRLLAFNLPRATTTSLSHNFPNPNYNNQRNGLIRPLLTYAISRSDRFNNAGNHILPAGLVEEWMPKHVAVVLDGNRRWCKSKGIPISYTPLYDSCMVFAQLCLKWGIPFATFFNFGTANWKRPKELNDLLFQQFQNFLEDNLEEFRRKEIRITVIGEISRLPKSLQKAIQYVEKATKTHSKFHMIFALSYGGQRDIVHAARCIGDKVKSGSIEPQDVDEAMIEKELWTTISGQTTPDPDLMIRTSGELRISNFLLWQMTYTELYFTDVNWPDFGEVEFIKALKSFQKRQRLYGN